VVYEFGGIIVVGAVYQPLVTTLPGDPTIKPMLAKSWDIKETGDGTTLTFKLDEKAKDREHEAVAGGVQRHATHPIGVYV